MLETLLPTLEPSIARRVITWHVITCEYPPQSGGVSDYTILVAKGLSSMGDEVHIWCPALPDKAPEIQGVQVHAALGKFAPNDLRNTGRELDRFPGPRRLLVQWVPHGFGYKSMNLPFCLWLWGRSKYHHDQVDVMVHEPFLQFLRGRWRQNAAATVHRLMTLVLLGAAREVCLSTPTWERMLRPFDWGRSRAYKWLPLPSTVPIVNDPRAVAAIRQQYAGQGLLLGHFGTFNPVITPMLSAIVPILLRRSNGASLLLIGTGSHAFRERLIREHPELDGKVHAVGQIDARDPRLSLHLSACDVLLQPYPDGVTTRRTTIMAALAHGLATITTTGELTEPLWSKSGAVALAPAHDSDVFVELALEILESAEKRASLGENGREFYQTKFDIRHIVELLRASGEAPLPSVNNDLSRGSNGY
jgi:glycosyltransferase involved in cell wall biosynthesis